MLFNSYEYLVFFLPLVLIGFFAISRRFGREWAIVWLVLASLFYYGWWNPLYLGLMLFSMGFNFAVGRAIGQLPDPRSLSRRLLLMGGIACNLGLLGYYKYANFFVDNVNALFDSSLNLAPIVLPLAISFFTFQQIAYLVDVHEGLVEEYSFFHYALFVTFFPQLIAGPIVHHSEMMPQFMRDEVLTPRAKNIAIGATIFFIGLFKKAVLADGVAAYATPVFNVAQTGGELSLFTAWGGALAYTLQLYFDFSGYTDMAIGSARLFGIRLPLNFFSPYKAGSIVAFWRRWHMTLSRFLRDYLYIRLGGNRHGPARRYGNLLATMVLGGLWHGAGWTFVIWGGLHGIYLMINHGWHLLCRQLKLGDLRRFAAWRVFAWGLTFLAVVVGWVFFRAESFDAAIAMLRAMVGLNGVALPNALFVQLSAPLQQALRDLGVGTFLGQGRDFGFTYLWVVSLLALALVAPNTSQLMRRYRPTVNFYPRPQEDAIQPLGHWMLSLAWRPSWRWALGIALLAGCGILALSSVSEFLYFQF
ncbi:MBOAT family protein [Magnetospira thiophila]